MKSINFKNISDFIIFGGGELVTDICLFLKKKRKKIIVVTSKQQANDFILSKKMKLSNFFKKNKIKFIVIDKNDKKWTSLIKKNSFGISQSQIPYHSESAHVPQISDTHCQRQVYSPVFGDISTMQSSGSCFGVKVSE